MRVSNYYMGKSKTMAVEFINGKNVRDREDLYDKLMAKLGFPEYFGRNLDALFDALTDPDVITGKTYLTVIGTQTLIDSLGDYGAKFVKTLEDAAYENGDFVFLKY